WHGVRLPRAAAGQNQQRDSRNQTAGPTHENSPGISPFEDICELRQIAQTLSLTVRPMLRERLNEWRAGRRIQPLHHVTLHARPPPRQALSRRCNGALQQAASTAEP